MLSSQCVCVCVGPVQLKRSRPCYLGTSPSVSCKRADSLALTLNLTCQSLIKTGNCQIKSELLQVILISHLSKYTSRALTILITMMTPTGVVEMKKRVFPSNNSHSIRTKFFVVENAFTLVSVK